MKSLLVNALKLAISVAIISYVLVEVQRDNSFGRLHEQSKNWGLLALAWMFALGAVSVSFLRWYGLVRAIELPLTVKDAFRLGFLGYLFNFISLGSVGGDLFKAVFLAREHAGRRTQAVATVIVDRLVGTYTLLAMSALAVLATGLHRRQSPEELQFIARAALAACAVGTVVVAALAVPAFTGVRTSEGLRWLPVVGPAVSGMVTAVRTYRQQWHALLVGSLMSLAMHTLFVLSIYMIARALPGEAPSLAAHFVIVPLAMMAAALPLPLGALGALEAAIDFLYTAIAGSQQGLVVALSYRLITVVVAIVGAGFYLMSRREVSSVLEEAEAVGGELAALETPAARLAP